MLKSPKRLPDIMTGTNVLAVEGTAEQFTARIVELIDLHEHFAIRQEPLHRLRDDVWYARIWVGTLAEYERDHG